LITRVDRSLNAAEELLSALLDISKLDSGMYNPEPSVISTAELFDQLHRRFQALAANRGLRLRVRPGKHYIFSDRNLLYRIIQNFLANAIRYTERGGVLLGGRVEKGQLTISVWDTGVGIDESDTVQIFQEFQRLDYARQLNEKGLGLGLAICDRIASMLGHAIRVRSQPGHGSCFSITVPLASDEAVAKVSQPAPAVGESGDLDNLTVLCIDNEPEILEGMKMLLERWGCTVMLAEHRTAAIKQALSRQTPDLVLVDYHLSAPANGLDVMYQLDESLKMKLPAIVITADRSLELEEAVRLRGYGLLRKPIKPAALRALMSNMVKRQ